uniref:MULE transposase domain-containing protein n=1 Tax=Tanacetum cinerariifolium TaxID=118510 RepID=A0A6L2N4Y7_TANCI|nr:hypothetical protein [Tanacetum cinerariifolium]
MFNQVRVNPDILVKVVQGQLQRDLESTNPNTNVKIAVKRNTDPFLPTRVFQRIYVCLGELKQGFRACRRDLLGLDGAFKKGPFLGQVLAAVGLDSNNATYPLAYALVEAECKSSCDRQKCIVPAIKSVFPNAEHIYCLRYIHENIKQGWCEQAYKDLLWRSASATSVKEFKKFSGRDQPVITLLEYIMEHCMKRTMNVQSVIEKCTGPLTPTATKIMESIKKGAHLMKLVGIWLNDRATPPQKRRNNGHNKATCKGQGQKATTGGNNVEASGSASRQAQQTKPAVG